MLIGLFFLGKWVYVINDFFFFLVVKLDEQ